MNILNKKINIRFLLVVYWLSFLLNQVFFVDFKKVFAEDNLSKTNIVAIIVDEDVYNKNESNIKWYATDYVQKNVSNSKAIVLPINVKNIKARDVTKILENMYFDWIDWESSKLEWLILMWDIPLPVVNNEWYVFPSIYPYVDFENQKYIFDQKSDFFILNSEDVWQPEVWHWLIKFDNDSDYKGFFDRMRKYDKDPSSYVMPRMWYDDFISLKKNFLSDSLPYYINKFTFAEDNSYHRYTNLFSDVLKSDYTESSLDIWKTLAEDFKNSDDADLKAYSQNIWKLSEEAWVSMENFEQKGTPTLLLKDSIGWFMKSYDELISSKYLSKARDNLDASARWYRKNSSWEIVDSIEWHYEKIAKQDAWMLWNDDVKSIFVELNDFMEKRINEKIENEKYYLDIPIVVIYYQYQNKNKNYIVTKYCEKTQNDFYYNFYFWKNALDVTWILDTSIYNWKFQNFATLSGNDDIPVDLRKSIAWSYGIFSQQTESNRWYNIFNIESELEYRSWNKIPEKREKDCVSHFSILWVNLFCKRKWYKVEKADPKEDPNFFAVRNRWWASPLNLDDSLALKTYDYKNSWLPIYDLWWTKVINKEQTDAYSYLGADSFGSLILVWDRYGEMEYPKYLNWIEQGTNKTRLSPSDFSIIDKYKPEWWVSKLFYLNSTWTIVKWVVPVNKKFESSKLWSPCSDYESAEIYHYKTIPSIKYNVSPTALQVSWMNLTTFDRPVDSQRNVTFKWIWWTIVKFDYPNIFQVQVYDNAWWNVVLNQTWGISSAIKEYLKKSVDKYNFQLKNQLSQKELFYAKNKDAFDFMSSSDKLTSPNRDYTLFSDSFLEDTLIEFFDVLVSKYWYEKIYWEKEIKTRQDKINFLSELMYRLNKNVYNRKSETSVTKDLNSIRESFDVNARIPSTVKDYLKKYDNWILLSPDFNSTWYEVAFINSDWDNYIPSNSVPSFISQLDSVKSKNNQKQEDSNNASDHEYKDTSEINQECWADSAWTVLLFDIKTFSSPRFEAFKCWMKKVGKKPFDIRINFDNALWSVYVPWWEDQFGVEESKDQYINQAQKNFSVFDAWNKKTQEDKETSWEINQKLQKLKSNVNISLDVNSFFVTDEKKKSFAVSSNVDLWKVDVTMYLTWDNCFWLKWFSSNLCTEKVLFSSNIFQTPREFEIDMKDKKSGFSSVMLKICLPYSNDCIDKQKVINFIPGSISNISFLAPSKRILPWAEIPIKVLAKDKYDNLVNQTVKTFNISVLSWDWLLYYGGTLSNTIDFQNFRDSDFILKASKDLKKSTIDIIVSGYNEDTVLINERLPISVVVWKLDIAHDAKILSNNSKTDYDLALKWDGLYITWSDWVRTIDESKLLKLSLTLKDQNWVYLDSVLRAYSQNWLLFPGILNKDTSYYNWKKINKTVFISQSSFIISGWKLDLFFHPNFKSWKEKIVLQIPGFDDFNINVSVLAWKEDKIVLDFPRTNMSVWQLVTWTIKIFDKRWNLVDRSVSVKLWKMWMIDIEWSQDRVVNGSWLLSLKDIWLVWEWYFYAVLKNVPLEKQVPWYQRIIVQEDLLPKEKLNVMYLNLFWSDWWNQRWYFSDNNKYINDIFGKSEKTLAITTQLTDLKKLKKIDLIVDQNAQIKNLWDLNPSIVMQSGSINYAFWNLWYINIWKKSDFEVSSFSDENLQDTNKWWFFDSFFGKKDSVSVPKSNEQQKISYIEENIKKNRNLIIYFPELTDSTIKTNVLDDWKIVVNGSAVCDFANSYSSQNVKINLSEKQIGWYYVFDLSLSEKIIWQIFVWRNDDYVLNSEIKIYDSYRYISKKIFADGSTNGKSWIWIVDTQSSMQEKNVSIESSYQDDLWIWFQSSFKNITLFGQWKSVGQSTLPFASEFLINFWDPVLKRISENVNIDKTSFDAGVWQVVFSDANKAISKTLPIDFNNDWLKDLLIVYKDWSIKLQKNYWWNSFDKNLQDLMLVEWWIRDVYVGDVDGNKYQDIIVWNNKNKMVVYRNDYGIFDVDWNLLCLNTNVDKWYISDSPDDLSDVSQIFLKDMDLDGNMDIITNDYDWYVKVFYGWKTTKDWWNYFSSLNYTCDAQRYSRQKNSEVLVKKYGISIDNTSFLQDTSLVRRNWFNPFSDEINNVDEEVSDDAKEYDDYDSPFSDKKLSKSQIKSLLKNNLKQVDDFNSSMEENLNTEILWDNYVTSPIDYIPINENSTSSELYYIPIKYLSGDDRVSVYKQFLDVNWWTLKKWDEVLVTVNLLAKQGWSFTYFEEIKWPWLVPTDDERKIKTFNFMSDNYSSVKTNWDVEPYQFMLDNIVLNWWQKLKFSYKVYYNQTNTPVVIWVKDISLPEKNLNIDWYNEIFINSTDACLKWRYIYKSQNRIYSEIFDDVQSKVADYLKDLEKNQNDTLDNSVSNVSEIDSLAWVSKLVDSYWWSKEKRNVKWILQSLFDEGWMSVSFDTQLVDKSVAKVSEGIDKALDWLCKWFSLWKNSGCGWIPVPFNQAFLAPGKYHLFGCFNLPLTPLDKWIPILAFPTNVPLVPVWPPSPPGAWWIFGWSTSQFRLYVSPTLTLWLWVAICLGPYSLWIRLPKPFRDIVWNCVVFALPPLTKSCKSNTKQPTTPGKLGTDSYDDYLVNLWDNWACTKWDVWEWSASSDAWGIVKTSESVFKLSVVDSNSSKIFEWNLWWFVRFDEEPHTFLQTNSTISFEWLDSVWEEKWFNLNSNEKISLKILWSKIKWLMKCVIQDWETRQIKYIVNNLTKMNVSLTLPDFSDISEWFSNLDTQNLSDIMTEIKQQKKDEWYVKQLTWVNRYLSQQSLDNLSSSFDNPFESILQLFDKVPLVNMETKDINIKVPLLTIDQMSSYSSYLKLWLEKNDKIIKRRNVAVEEMLNVCWVSNKEEAKDFLNQISSSEEIKDNKLFTDKDSESCSEALHFLDGFIKFNQNSQKLVYVVKQNINILEEYKKFPFKLYEWIHVTDRYVTETISFVSSFVWKLTFRLKTNATRFSQYVDSLTILIHAIKTRQVIVDFSLDWTEKCSKCTNDNYSSYSCSLSFLCPKLPILPIPPFKIPNISLDLSHLDLGMNILLPKFNFSPINISLPTLPDLPEPPEYQVNLDVNSLTLDLFDLPSIPLLPSPPDLPELPSFIPNVEIDLPTLPPAPKIPNISPKIEAILKVAKFIWKIFCIVKWWIWLVGEKWVKARIEQMTQRTRNVPIFDYFNLTTKYKDPPLRWFDWKLDAYLELRYNFDWVYNFINSAASFVNWFSNKIENKAAEAIDNAEDQSAKKIEETKQNIKEDIIKWSYMSDDWQIKYEQYDKVYSELNNWVNYFKLYAKDDKKTYEKLDKISYGINNKSNISVESENINKIAKEVVNIMEKKRSEYNTLSDNILNNYDKFISDLKLSGILVSEEKEKNSFETNILNIDSLNREILSKQESPTKTYLSLNEKFVDGYLSAIKDNSAESLNMTQDTYYKSQKYLSELKNKISRTNEVDLYSQNQASDKPCPTCVSSKTIAYEPNTSSPSSSSQDNDLKYQQDISVYTKWVFLDNIENWKITKINLIESSDQIENVWNNYFWEDINNDKNLDLIMWDDSSVYVKYFGQDDNYYSKNWKDITKSDSKYHLYSNANGRHVLEKLEDISKDWIWNFNSVELKMFDRNFEVKNFLMKWQTFENLKFSFSNSLYLWDNVDGYVIRLNKRVDTFFDKYQISDFVDDKLLSKKYIVILPNGWPMATWVVVSFDSISKKPLKNLLTGTVLWVRYFDLDQDIISVVLNEVDRSWQYAQIATLNLDDEWLWLFTSSKYSLLTQWSPWSNQILWWKQIISDDKWPIPYVNVYRPSIKKIISTWYFHDLYVNTFYDLNIMRTDDVAVSEMRISKDGKEIKRVSNWSKDGNISLNNLNFTWNDSLKFQISARDFNWNESIQDIELNVSIPDIEVLSVNKIDSKMANIVSKISHDLDWWVVTFEKMVWKYRNKLLGSDSKNLWYDLVPLQTIITWWIFDLSDSVWFYDSKWNKFANINPINWSIKIFDEYIFGFELISSFIDNFLNVSIIDKQTNEHKFDIKLPSEKLVDIKLLQSKPYYDLIKLYGKSFGVFDNGYCLKNMNQDCVMYISLSGQIYSPSVYSSEFVWDYKFNYTWEYVNYYMRDKFGNWLIDMNIKIKNLLQK